MKRGQATTELALLSLVFVTVLLFGVHFAELGALKLRVQQAGAFALWSATGDRGHKLDRARASQSPLFFHANQLRDGSGRTPEQATRERFADFDADRGSARRQVRWATTRGSQLQVRCEPAAVAVPPSLTEPLRRLAPGYHWSRFNNRDVDAVQCTAEGRLELFGVAGRFAEDSRGFFGATALRRPFVDVCAFGRARNGRCRGGVPVAFDDWGLQGTEGGESSQCGFDCSYFEVPGSNVAYKQTVERLYEEYAQSRSVSRNWAIANFVRELFTRAPADATLMSVVPVDERDFRFAFTGEDSPGRPFSVRTTEVDGSSGGFGPNRRVPHHWATTPYSSRYRAAYDDRGQCFAGLPCNRSPFDKQRWR